MPYKPYKNITVKSGDTLTWIVQEVYGEYIYMLPIVIQANPQILNPDLIIPGQVIRLPRLEKKSGQSIAAFSPVS